MKRDLELMTVLLIEAENSCGREISDPKEVNSILLLQDEEYVDAQTQYSDDGIPQSTKIIRVRSKGHSALENMRAYGFNILGISHNEKSEMPANKKEKIKDGFVSTRNREIERYEKIMYCVAAGCAVLIFNFGEFCFSNEILSPLIKWLLFITLLAAGFTIISLFISDKASASSRENALKMLNKEDKIRQGEYRYKAFICDYWTCVANRVALIAFLFCIILTIATTVILFLFQLPNNTQSGHNNKMNAVSIKMEVIQ